MRYDSLLIEIVATPGYLLLLFLVITGLLHIFLVHLSNLDDLAWKKVDYIWLSAASLGLLLSSASIDQWISQKYLEGIEIPRTEHAYLLLRDHVRFGGNPSSPLCAPRNKSELSPPDFDDIVREQQVLCKKFTELHMAMPAALTPPFPVLEQSGLVAPMADAKYETWYVSEVNRLGDNYRAQQARYDRLAKSSKASVWTEILQIVGPLIVTFALALRITKVSGELANAKKKAKQTHIPSRTDERKTPTTHVLDIDTTQIEKAPSAKA